MWAPSMRHAERAPTAKGDCARPASSTSSRCSVRPSRTRRTMSRLSSLRGIVHLMAEHGGGEGLPVLVELGLAEWQDPRRCEATSNSVVARHTRIAAHEEVLNRVGLFRGVEAENLGDVR